MPEDGRLVVSVAQACAQEARRFYETGVAVDQKTSDFANPVTEADRAAELVAREMITRERPRDSITGEEGDAVTGDSGRRWIVDPVDGTINFTRSLPGWCSAVALLEKTAEGEQSVASAICNPLDSQTWLAERGSGAVLNGLPLQVSNCTSLDQAVLWTYLDPGRAKYIDGLAKLARASASIRAFGVAATGLCLVARAELDGWACPGLPEWDWEPGALIVEEAGGAVSVQGEWRLAAASAELLAEMEAVLESRGNE